MIGKKQTMLYEEGRLGNCFPACIASILECEIEDIPDFIHLESFHDWLSTLNDWLVGMGLIYVEFVTKDNPEEFFKGYKTKVHHILAGCTERTDMDSEFPVTHAVVALNGKMVFDPHPSNAGLLEGGEKHIGLRRLI